MSQINILIHKIDTINKDIRLLEMDMITIDKTMSESSRKLVVAAGINVLNSQRSNLLRQLKELITVSEYC